MLLKESSLSVELPASDATVVDTVICTHWNFSPYLLVDLKLWSTRAGLEASVSLLVLAILRGWLVRLAKRVSESPHLHDLFVCWSGEELAAPLEFDALLLLDEASVDQAF